MVNPSPMFNNMAIMNSNKMNLNMNMMNNGNMNNMMMPMNMNMMNNGNNMINMNNMNINNINMINNMNMNNENFIQMMMMKNKQLMNNMNNNMNNINNMQFNSQNQMMQYQKNNNNKKLNQIVGIESVIPIQTTSKDIIDDKQYDIITQICVEAIKDKKKDIASYCTEKIMNKLKGQWFVLIHNSNEDNFEFRFSKFQYKKLLIFQYGEKIVYVLPLK